MLTINEKDWEDVTTPGQVPMYCAMVDAVVCGQVIRMAAFAIQVTIDDGDGSQNPDGDDSDYEWFNRLMALAELDGPYQTVTIKGKPCVVWVEPTCE